MRIISTKVLKGPNYWSGYRTRLIEMKLDLGRFEELPTNLLPGFTEALLELLPGLEADHCSEGHEGGFVERMQEGTWLGHVIEHVALELQTVAGMDCGYGRTRSTGTDGVYHVVFAYEYENAGKLAGTAAVQLVTALANGEQYDVAEDISMLKQLAGQQRPEPFAQAMMEAAEERNIPYHYNAEAAILQIGQGSGQTQLNLNEKAFDSAQQSSGEEVRASAKALFDNLYAEGKANRIPIVAVTGTNGKTTTTRLIAHIARLSGRSVGFTASDGIYVNNRLIKAGDCSGPKSATLLLNNNEVAFAVLECARGGILRSGLAFDHCNISIVTNVSEDHMGLGDINTIAQLAKVKSVVASSTFKEGYAVLNAADKLVMGMRKDLDCHIALFATDGTVEEISKHINEGGMAAFVSNGSFRLARNGHISSLISVNEVPLSFNGTSGFMIQNVLAAILASAISGFSPEQIVTGLQSFYPSAEQTPGRLNLFPLKQGNLILDYVHNTGGYLELKSFIAKQEALKKTGIIYATGDRRPEDIRLIGGYAAEMFDEIIINNQHEPRGIKPETLTEWLLEGIKQVDDALPVKILPDERTAITYAIEQAQPGELIFASINDIQGSLELVKNLLKEQADR